MITRAEYEEALAAIDKGLCQLEPDGKNCAICQDTDHQAWECRFNPVRAMKQRDRLAMFIEVIHDQIHNQWGR